MVLRAVDFGEADRIVTLLTERRGRLTGLAKSARKSQKRFAGALEPFGLIEAEISVGAAEVGRLASARLVRGFPKLLGSLLAMRVAGASLELVRRATPPRESDAELLACVVSLFESLEATPHASAGVVFTARYLALLGLAPQLDACAKCGKQPRPGQPSSFDPQRGAIVCRACGGGPLVLTAGTRGLLRAAIEAGLDSPLDAWAEPQREAADTLLGAFVQRHAFGEERR